MAFFTPDSGVMIAVQGTALHTADGGDSWEAIRLENGGSLLGLATHGNDVLVVGGRGRYATLAHSTDRGRSWAQVEDHSWRSNTLYHVGWFDSTTAVVSGLWGIMLRTTDGAATWEPVEIDTKNALFHLEIIDARTAVVVGGAGVVWRTDDAGATWSPHESGTREFLRGLRFIDRDTGYAVGDNGTIIKTTDGGVNWVKIESGTTNILRSVDFDDAGHGVISGYFGTLLETTDGGVTWTRNDPPTLEHLTGVRIHGNRDFAMGINGTLLVLTDETLVAADGTLGIRMPERGEPDGER